MCGNLHCREIRQLWSISGHRSKRSIVNGHLQNRWKSSIFLWRFEKLWLNVVDPWEGWKSMDKNYWTTNILKIQWTGGEPVEIDSHGWWVTCQLNPFMWFRRNSETVCLYSTVFITVILLLYLMSRKCSPRPGTTQLKLILRMHRYLSLLQNQLQKRIWQEETAESRTATIQSSFNFRWDRWIWPVKIKAS